MAAGTAATSSPLPAGRDVVCQQCPGWEIPPSSSSSAAFSCFSSSSSQGFLWEFPALS